MIDLRQSKAVTGDILLWAGRGNLYCTLYKHGLAIRLGGCSREWLSLPPAYDDNRFGVLP
jgi:hypothetical protein